MSTNRHTDISAGAAATAANLNAPLGELDAALNLTGVHYYDTTGTSTTCTLAGTFYPVTAYEVSFTPSYTGQAYVVALSVGQAYSTAAGAATWRLDLTDASNVAITSTLMALRCTAANTSAASVAIAGTRLWWAGAGDVGVVRKFKVYVSHSVAATAVVGNFTLLETWTH